MFGVGAVQMSSPDAGSLTTLPSPSRPQTLAADETQLQPESPWPKVVALPRGRGPPPSDSPHPRVRLSRGGLSGIPGHAGWAGDSPGRALGPGGSRDPPRLLSGSLWGLALGRWAFPLISDGFPPFLHLQNKELSQLTPDPRLQMGCLQGRPGPWLFHLRDTC